MITDEDATEMFILMIFSRSYSSLPEFLYHLTYVTQSRYAGAVLNGLEFHNRTSLVGLQWQDETGRKLPCHANAFGFGCRYYAYIIVVEWRV
jgi:hypothetical protein